MAAYGELDYRELREGLEVTVQRGPFAGYRGSLVRWNVRHAVVDLPGFCGRRVQVQVPTEYVCEVPSLLLSREEQERRLQGDPYAYIARAVWDLLELQADRFRCVSPFRADLQVGRNWVWFKGRAETEAFERSGLYLDWRVNCYVARLPVLLVTHRVLRGITSHRKNANILPVREWRALRKAAIRTKLLRPKWCYRGRVYDPADFLRFARRPRRTLGVYRLERGAYVPASVQFQPVPELGIWVDVRYREKTGEELRPRPLCYALPLIPALLASRLGVRRWGLLSSRFHQYVEPVLPENAAAVPVAV
jgi:hypothetical protein